MGVRVTRSGRGPGRGPVRFKVCGLTTLAQVEAAAEAGAGYVGLNFFPPSPRAVTPEQSWGGDDILAYAAVRHQEGFKGEDDRLDIDPICLGAAPSVGNQKAGGIQNMGLEAVADQETR